MCMVMGFVWVSFLIISLVSAIINGTGSALASATVQGAQSGVTLAISIAGAMILWSGVGKLLEASGIMGALTRLLRPFLHRLFPDTRHNKTLSGYLSSNICANLLGLGNAATPMGILAARELKDPLSPSLATDQLCRLIVLNTASIQLIPANVAAIRAGQGAANPFDILPAVWITSLCSAGIGLLAAWCFGKLWRHD